MSTIYLSSTYENLKDYRLAVVESLPKAGVLCYGSGHLADQGNQNA
jgi:hypothetical protein